MSRKVLVLLGTRKGGFILESDETRKAWRLRGPFCESWPTYYVTFDPASRTILAGGGNEWFGPAVWRSPDLGETWTHSSEGMTYGEDGPNITKVWVVTPGLDAIYAGVDPAGLFRSEDGGVTWSHVEGLRNHPSSASWFPGGGGLILHSILPHRTDPQKLWVAMSAVGTFYTDDRGGSWRPLNKGVRADFLPEKYPEFGQCVHNLVAAPNGSQRLYQQNHCGVYRSDDAGESWDEITPGLPSEFGFPMAVHPRDPETIYVIPLSADNGRFMPEGKGAVWRSRDGGKNWQAQTHGLPGENAYLGVLRQAMAVDRLDPAGVYFGTSTGHLFASSDEGDSWQKIADYLPPIWSVETVVLED